MAEEILKNEVPSAVNTSEFSDGLDGEHLQPESNPAASIQDMLGEQNKEAEEFAAEFLKRVLRLRGVRIDREKFLRAELHKRGLATPLIDRALGESPAAAGVSPSMLDEIARDSIDFETKKSTSLSFAAGLPGGFAMIGTVPADISQFYIHAFRIMQKVAYTYGWQSFLDDTEDIDDETLGKLASFLGVMMGVAGASASVTTFAARVARPALQRQITNVALTKTSWYLPMKHTLKIIGIQVTKKSFASAATKVVPVVGGVISGGLTFVTLNTQATRLMKHLREIPPPNVDAAEYLAAVKHADEQDSGATKNFGAAVGSAVSNAGDVFRPVDLDGDGIPDEAQALTAVKGAASALKDGASGAAGKFGSMMRRRKGERATSAGGGEQPMVDGSDDPTRTEWSESPVSAS